MGLQKKFLISKIKALNIFLRQRYIKKTAIIIAIFFIMSILLIALKWPSLPPQIPLYYSVIWGEKQLASAWELSIIPTLILSVSIINFAIAFFLVRDQELFVKILIYTALFCSGLLFITLFKIIFLVS